MPSKHDIILMTFNSKQASLAAKKRWKGTTEKQRSKFASKIAKIKHSKKTKKEKSEYGKMMVEARIKKYGQKRHN